MCGEEGFVATHETVHLVKFIGKGCSIFFCAYVTLLSTTGYKVLNSYGLPGHTTTEQTYTISGLC